jgi:small subunit ribosomal protein S16
VAVKIKLKRLGKMRHPQYRIVIADARTKRDGRAIEEIGKYHPKEDPSFIEVDSARVQYWLGVGAQPTEAVEAILRVTGDWQTFKGLPGAEGTLRMPAERADRKAVFEAAAKEAAGEPRSEATTTRTRKPKAETVAATPEPAVAAETSVAEPEATEPVAAPVAEGSETPAVPQTSGTPAAAPAETAAEAAEPAAAAVTEPVAESVTEPVAEPEPTAPGTEVPEAGETV